MLLQNTYQIMVIYIYGLGMCSFEIITFNQRISPGNFLFKIV